MSDEDRENCEVYLELERYIEELQAGYVAQPPADLTPERTRIYHMAAFFHSASPGAAEPRAEFVEALRSRLLAMSEEAKDDVPRIAFRVARCSTIRSRKCRRPHAGHSGRWLSMQALSRPCRRAEHHVRGLPQWRK